MSALLCCLNITPLLLIVMFNLIQLQLGEDQYRNAGFLSTLVTATTVPPEVPATQPSTDPPGISQTLSLKLMMNTLRHIESDNKI